MTPPRGCLVTFGYQPEGIDTTDPPPLFRVLGPQTSAHVSRQGGACDRNTDPRRRVLAAERASFSYKRKSVVPDVKPPETQDKVR